MMLRNTEAKERKYEFINIIFNESEQKFQFFNMGNHPVD